MGLYLGIDIGGTRSRWSWSDRQAVLERPGGIQVAVRGTEAAAAALAGLLAEIRERDPDRSPDFTAIGMAGAGDPDIRRRLEAALRSRGVRWPLVVVGDIAVAAAAALRDGPGVAIWSGTGSFAVARDPAGDLHRVGGRGYLLGDAGSGYDLVRRAGVAALRALDGVGPQTELLGDLAEAFSAAAPERLGGAMQASRPSEVAARFPVVRSCAERGDAEAVEVLRGGARSLAEQAVAAGQRAGLEPSGAAICVGGGLVESGGIFSELLAAELARAGFPAPRRLTGGAAPGGVLLARAVHRVEAPICRWLEGGGAA